MTFNPNADISKGRASEASGSGGMGGLGSGGLNLPSLPTGSSGPSTGGIVGGGIGGIVLAIVVVLISQFTGVDLSGILGGSSSSTSSVVGGDSGGTSTTDLSSCNTGADANNDVNCRVKGAAASLDTYWASQVQGYTSTDVILFSGQTSTGCGDATTDVGPFYCPTDKHIYIDTAFYQELQSQFGATAGPLAQLYVIGHEWGHHIQDIVGIMDNKDLQATGATSDSVRLELQADCFAGAWIGAASTIKDENGQTFLQPVTQDQITDALNAAAAVGDDHIEQTMQGSVDPESFTHGTSAQRQKWFSTGLQGGPNSCDTFSVNGSQL